MMHSGSNRGFKVADVNNGSSDSGGGSRRAHKGVDNGVDVNGGNSDSGGGSSRAFKRVNNGVDVNCGT